MREVIHHIYVTDTTPQWMLDLYKPTRKQIAENKKLMKRMLSDPPKIAGWRFRAKV